MARLFVASVPEVVEMKLDSNEEGFRRVFPRFYRQYDAFVRLYGKDAWEEEDFAGRFFQVQRLKPSEWSSPFVIKPAGEENRDTGGLHISALSMLRRPLDPAIISDAAKRRDAVLQAGDASRGAPKTAAGVPKALSGAGATVAGSAPSDGDSDGTGAGAGAAVRTGQPAAETEAEVEAAKRVARGGSARSLASNPATTAGAGQGGSAGPPAPGGAVLRRAGTEAPAGRGGSFGAGGGGGGSFGAGPRSGSEPGAAPRRVRSGGDAPATATMVRSPSAPVEGTVFEDEAPAKASAAEAAPGAADAAGEASDCATAAAATPGDVRLADDAGADSDSSAGVEEEKGETAGAHTRAEPLAAKAASVAIDPRATVDSLGAAAAAAPTPALSWHGGRPAAEEAGGGAGSAAAAAAAAAEQYSAMDVEHREARAREEHPVVLRVEMLHHMRQLLRGLGVHGETLTRDVREEEDKRRFLLVFPCPLDRNEQVLRALQAYGLGELFGTVSVVPLDLAKMAKQVDGTVATAGEEEDEEEEEKRVTFAATARSRLVLFDHLVGKILDGAQFTFDFLALVVVASLLAGVGLAANNTVVIVASMLVSPIMGPIMAVTFGAVIADGRMVRTGLRSELLGLVLCVLVGAVVAAVNILAGTTNILQPEMESRGLWSGIPVGLSIALPSGIGVALSVSGANTASLVGVAISASLLPPAVNAGMLWMYALLGRSSQDGRHSPAAMAELGAVSLLLTVVNIACIFVCATGMFKLKELGRLPGVSLTWNPEIKARKHVQRVVRRGQDGDVRRRFRDYLDLVRAEEGASGIAAARPDDDEEEKDTRRLGKAGMENLFDGMDEETGEAKSPERPQPATVTSAPGSESRLRNRFQRAARRAGRRHGGVHSTWDTSIGADFLSGRGDATVAETRPIRNRRGAGGLEALRRELETYAFEAEAQSTRRSIA